jgi:hypothetical protein
MVAKSDKAMSFCNMVGPLFGLPIKVDILGALPTVLITRVELNLHMPRSLTLVAS